MPNCIQPRVDIGNIFKVRLQLLVHLQCAKGLIQLSNSLLYELKESPFVMSCMFAMFCRSGRLCMQRMDLSRNFQMLCSLRDIRFEWFDISTMIFGWFWILNSSWAWFWHEYILQDRIKYIFHQMRYISFMWEVYYNLHANFHIIWYHDS